MGETRGVAVTGLEGLPAPVERWGGECPAVFRLAQAPAISRVAWLAAEERFGVSLEVVGEGAEGAGGAGQLGDEPVRAEPQLRVAAGHRVDRAQGAVRG